MNKCNELDYIKNEIKIIENKKIKFENSKLYKYLEARKILQELYSYQEKELKECEKKMESSCINSFARKQQNIDEIDLKELTRYSQSLERNIFNFLKYELILIVTITVLFLGIFSTDKLIGIISIAESKSIENLLMILKSKKIHMPVVGIILIFLSNLIALAIQRKWRKCINDKFYELKNMNYKLKTHLKD